MKIAKFLAGSSIALLISMPVFALAEDSAVDGQDSRAGVPGVLRPALQKVREEGLEIRTENREELKGELRENRQEFNADREEARAELRGDVKGISVSSTIAVGDREEAFKEMREQFEANRKIELEKFKEEQKTAREQFEQKRKAAQEQLKKRLAVIKDERKREIASSTAVMFNNINAKITTQMGLHVDQIDAVLVKISARADTAATNGKDVTTVRADIVLAQADIAAARAAITAQIAKVYTVNISTEAKLKNDFGAVRQQLGNDLKTVQEAIEKARRSTRKAGADLALLNPGDNTTSTAPTGTTPTSTTSTTP